MIINNSNNNNNNINNNKNNINNNTNHTNPHPSPHCWVPLNRYNTSFNSTSKLSQITFATTFKTISTTNSVFFHTHRLSSDHYPKTKENSKNLLASASRHWIYSLSTISGWNAKHKDTTFRQPKTNSQTLLFHHRQGSFSGKHHFHHHHNNHRNRDTCPHGYQHLGSVHKPHL